MISHLLVHPDLSQRIGAAEKLLKKNNLSRNHPNLLWFSDEEKLGIEQARLIKEFLSLKPYQGQSQAVVLIAAENLTLEAQNALLKTLEEPPEHALIILGVSAEDQLLPTIISRCQTINLENTTSVKGEDKIRAKFEKDIEKLLPSTMEQRFQYIEKLTEREQFLPALTAYFRHKLLEKSVGVPLRPPNPPPGCPHEQVHNFLKDILEAERWAAQNVNIRAILEYLMLRMPVSKKLIV